jgi:hypothetical protein
VAHPARWDDRARSGATASPRVEGAMVREMLSAMAMPTSRSRSYPTLVIALLLSQGCGSSTGATPAPPPGAPILSYDDDPCAPDGDGGPDMPATAPSGLVSITETTQAVTLAVGGPSYQLADGCTRIEMRTVHPTPQLGPGGLYGVAQATGGLPYVKTHGGWAEILHRIVVYSRGYTFTIENDGCQTVDMSCGDCVFADVASCPLHITTSASRPAPVQPESASDSFSIPSRYDAFATDALSGQFFTLRELGFIIGNLDNSSPPMPTGLRMGIDFVTSFGVVNVDVDDYGTQVIGSTVSGTVGPLQIQSVIRDVGNGNTHCYTGTCINIFALDVTSTVTDPSWRVPAILDYE